MNRFTLAIQPLLQQMLRPALNVTVLVLALIGLAYMADFIMGDDKLPRFRSLARRAPELLCAVDKNSSAELFHRNTFQPAPPKQYWQSLQPTLKILDAVNPTVADWVRRLRQERKLSYALLPFQQYVFPWEVIASYNANSGVLHLGPTFWGMPDGDKAAYIVHEYRHSRQNRAKVIATLGAQVLSGRLRNYGSRLEDEAYLYQLDAYRAMGMPHHAIRPYLLTEGLVHYEDLGRMMDHHASQCAPATTSTP